MKTNQERKLLVRKNRVDGRERAVCVQRRVEKRGYLIQHPHVETEELIKSKELMTGQREVVFKTSVHRLMQRPKMKTRKPHLEPRSKSRKYKKIVEKKRGRQRSILWGFIQSYEVAQPSFPTHWFH